jgi:hypothetical protein
MTQSQKPKVKKIDLIVRRRAGGIYRRFEGIIDEVTEKAVGDLEYLLMQGREVIVAEAVRPMVQYLYYYMNTVLKACYAFVEDLKKLEGRLGDVVAKVVEAGKVIEGLVQEYGGIPEVVEDRIPRSVVEILTKLDLARVEGGKIVFHRIEEVYSAFVHCTRLLREVFKVK